MIGKRGEDLAVDYLSGAGWTVLERNWRCRYGEIDVIAADGSDLVIVEVKTRTGQLYADPAEAVTYEKYRRLRRLAGLWLAEQDGNWPVVRFDVIALQIDSAGVPDLRHLRGVF